MPRRRTWKLPLSSRQATAFIRAARADNFKTVALLQRATQRPRLLGAAPAYARETEKSPLPRGPYRGSAARQNEVGLASPRPPPPHAAHPPRASIPHCDRDALYAAAPPLMTVQNTCIIYTVGDAQAQFIRMKSTSKKRTPSIVNLTVKRRYLTEREVE